MLDVIIELARDGMTMICVTHEMALARAMADRVLFMDDGAIVEDAPPDVYFSAPEPDRAKRFPARMHR